MLIIVLINLRRAGATCELIVVILCSYLAANFNVIFIDFNWYFYFVRRFVRADEVAKLWGIKKSNEKMSFEKFSRAMRYHYKQGVLVSVPTARLVYQFGPKAPSYKTPNPNFESDISKLNMR